MEADFFSVYLRALIFATVVGILCLVSNHLSKNRGFVSARTFATVSFVVTWGGLAFVMHDLLPVVVNAAASLFVSVLTTVMLVRVVYPRAVRSSYRGR